MRNHVCRLFASIVALAAIAFPASAQNPHISREAIEWCDIWLPEADGVEHPRVLLIGDSISRAYYKQVAEKLRGKASVARLATSKSIGDPVLLKEVAMVLGQYPFDVVHFNNGLHGFGYSEEEYKEHFPEMVATIRKHAPKAKLIWATTTPKRTKSKLEEIDLKTERVKARNEIAQTYVATDGIPVDDLYSLVENHPEYYSQDGTHFNDKGIAAQAVQVAEAIEKILQ